MTSFFTLYMVHGAKRQTSWNWRCELNYKRRVGKKVSEKRVFSKKNRCRTTYFTDTDWFYRNAPWCWPSSIAWILFSFFSLFFWLLVFGIWKVFCVFHSGDRKVKPLHRTTNSDSRPYGEVEIFFFRLKTIHKYKCWKKINELPRFGIDAWIIISPNFRVLKGIKKYLNQTQLKNRI